MVNNNRDLYVDVAKGLGILLIACIHTEVFGVVDYALTFIQYRYFSL